MRWSRVTALTQFDDGSDAAHGPAAGAIIVLPSPTEYQRSGEAQRSRVGYAIAIAGAAFAAFIVFRLVGMAIPQVAGMLPALSPQTGKATPAPQQATQTGQAAPAPGGQSRAAPSSTPAGAAAPAAPTATASVATPTTAPVATPIAARPASPPTPVAAAGAAPTAAANVERVHTVQKGDTLYSIAQRNGTTVDALVTANRLGSPSAVLSIGQQIAIP